MGKARSALRSQAEALRRARSFVEKASRMLDVVEAYIVGSRARGDYLDVSDVDVVILARGVEGLNSLERLELLAGIAEPNVEYLVYTPREWREARTAWIRELKKEAVKIYPTEEQPRKQPKTREP